MRLLKARDTPSEFMKIVNSLQDEEQLKITMDMERLPQNVRRQTIALLRKAFDTALEQPVLDHKELATFIRMVRTTMETWFAR